MRARFVVPVLLLVFAAPLASEAQQARQIDGRTFVVQKITEAGIPWALRTMFDRPLHLTFSAQRPRFRANTGCNTLMGDYAIVDGAFMLNRGAGSTLMGCSNRKVEQLEAMLVAFLRSSPRLSLDGDRLLLESNSVQLEALDSRIADPDRPLIGTNWQYNSEIHSDGVSGELNVTVPTLVLAADGTFSYRGCQRIVGRYEQAGARVTLVPGPGTGSPCADQRAAELERRIIGMLRERALTATIRGGSLRLLRDDGVGVAFTEVTPTLRQ